ncbi:hypothetical protein BJ912DRAFT_1085847, partial [Pholiota molesta]
AIFGCLRCCSPPLCQPDNPVWVFISDFRVRFISIFFFLLYCSISLSLFTGPGRQEHPLLLISLSSRFGCFSFSFLSLVSFFFSWASHEQFMMTCICGFHFFSLFSFFYFLCNNTDIWNAFHLSRGSSMRRCCSFIYPDLLSCTCSESLFRDFFYSFYLSSLYFSLILLPHPSLSCLFNRRLTGRWRVLGPAYTPITLAAARSYNNHTAHSLFADFHERGSTIFSA